MMNERLTFIIFSTIKQPCTMYSYTGRNKFIVQINSNHSNEFVIEARKSAINIKVYFLLTVNLRFSVNKKR